MSVYVRRYKNADGIWTVWCGDGSPPDLPSDIAPPHLYPVVVPVPCPPYVKA